MSKPKLNLMIIILLLAVITLPISAETGDVDLNSYYAYPVSAGAYYHPLSAIGNSALADFSIYEFSGEVRIPLPWIPSLQPLVRGGYIGYDFSGSVEELNQDWTHFHVFGGLGLGYSHRISREFELGAELSGNLSQSYFTELVYNGVNETQGQLNIVLGLGGRFALNPSFNFSISINPTLNYSLGLGPLHDYDGFTYGFGFSGTYRFGDDPDAAGTVIKAIRFDSVNLPFIFAAMQSYYVKNPAGTITISNKEDYPLEDISLSFMQPGFMDSPSPVASDILLGPGESIEVPIRLTYNNEVFSTQGITPLTGEVITNYTLKGREVEQRKSVTYDLYDSNSLTWDDDRKAAAFITAQDSAVRNYSSYIRQIHRDEVMPYLSGNLQFAMQAFNALGELGILYQIDPTAPFTEMQGDSMVVDSISLPRETLKRLTGDCDDLSVLYCTMLESIGIETALLTVPGHIFCAFNTDVPSADFKMVSPDRSRIIEVDGSIWVPVEITMIGKRSFTEAWSKAVAEFAEWESAPERRGFYKTGEAQGLFRPVVLRETDLGLQYGDDEAVVAAFRKDLEALSQFILKPVRTEAETTGKPKAWNNYGVAAAKLGAYSTAEAAFKKAVDEKVDYTSAKLNLGSLYYLTQKYAPAFDVYYGIEQSAGNTRLSKRILFNLYLNMSKTSYALDKNDEAGNYYMLAMEIDPDKAADFSYLGAGGDSSRASEAADEKILFFE